MAQRVTRLHQLDHGNVRTIVDELMISVRGIGPAPRVGEGVELRLAHLPARLAEENVVIGVGVERRIEVDKIDAGVGKLFPIRKPLQIVAEIQSIHSTIISQNSRPEKVNVARLAKRAVRIE